MKQAVLAALMMTTPAAPALGEPAAPMVAASKESPMASQDPLMRQILHRQLTQRNGGITAAVRIASGQSIELQLPDPDNKPDEELKDALNSGEAADPTADLKPVAGLISSQDAGAPAAQNIVKPTEQLKALHRQGTRQNWGEGMVKVAEATPETSD